METEKYRILIVEDEPDLLREWKKVLEDVGYETDTAENGRTALALWKKKIYDLILVDLRMPVMDGGEVIEAVKAESPLTQIVIISGQGLNHGRDLITAINRDVYKYLPKPVDLDVIVDTVKDALYNRDPVLVSLEELAEQNPEDEIMLLVGREEYTAERLFHEVRKMTSVGKEFYAAYRKRLTNFKPPQTDQTIDELLGIKGVVE